MLRLTSASTSPSPSSRYPAYRHAFSPLFTPSQAHWHRVPFRCQPLHQAFPSLSFSWPPKTYLPRNTNLTCTARPRPPLDRTLRPPRRLSRPRPFRDGLQSCPKQRYVFLERLAKSASSSSNLPVKVPTSLFLSHFLQLPLSTYLPSPSTNPISSPLPACLFPHCSPTQLTSNLPRLQVPAPPKSSHTSTST